MVGVTTNRSMLLKTIERERKMNSLDFNRGYTTLIGSAIDFVADLHNLSIDEVKRAMDGEEYWCI